MQPAVLVKEEAKMMEKFLAFLLFVLMVTGIAAIGLLIRDIHKMNFEERQNKREDK